jgi:acyl CoA:acetate/3-ketoacid CoA transferase alpha subunit
MDHGGKDNLMLRPKLVFVYNAEAGLINGVVDSLHKVISPGTYECALCAITHGFFTVEKAWRAYLRSLPVEAQFFHRTDFAEAYPAAHFGLPAILLDRGGVLSELVSPQQMKTLADVNGLSIALDAALVSAEIKLGSRSGRGIKVGGVR